MYHDGRAEIKIDALPRAQPWLAFTINYSELSVQDQWLPSSFQFMDSTTPTGQELDILLTAGRDSITNRVCCTFQSITF